MKLLKLEIGDTPKEKQFRSLHLGFKVEFHSLDDKGTKAMETFSPFCFAGLNGSGKSNVLEALAAIFYHLECCVAKFKPKTFEKYFRPNECNPDAFTLEYLIGQHNSKPYALAYFDKIIISKKLGEPPTMNRQAFPFSKEQEIFPVSLIPRSDLREPQAAEGKSYLPQIIVGYSSGENEILSLPFRKSRLINFDKYKEDYIKGYKFEEPESSLIYIDSDMSQAVLLSCLLFENQDALRPLRNELGIIGIRSFRIYLNNRKLISYADKPILEHIKETIEKLKNCSSSWQIIDADDSEKEDGLFSFWVFDFFVDENTIRAFKDNFNTSFELFRFLQVLYELNANSVLEKTKEDVYKSKGLYTDWKIPEAIPDANIFYFENFYILKEIEDGIKIKELLLREFSDGEHQFLHTMGICLMLKDRKSILLLDEPETHFNPSWRARFIKILNDSITSGSNREITNDSFNVHSLKDILLTSHSPFIISDCMPNNVLFFDKNEKTKKIQARKASELGFNTYGTSVEIILDELFNYNQSIGDLSNEIFERIDFESIKTKEDVENTKRLFRHLGESIEKDLALARLNQRLPPDDNDSNNSNESGNPVGAGPDLKPVADSEGRELYEIQVFEEYSEQPHLLPYNVEKNA